MQDDLHLECRPSSAAAGLKPNSKSTSAEEASAAQHSARRCSARRSTRFSRAIQPAAGSTSTFGAHEIPLSCRARELVRVTMGSESGGNGNAAGVRGSPVSGSVGQGTPWISRSTASSAAILADPNCREFILADAKDADMASRRRSPGLSPGAHAGEMRLRTLEEYREQMRLITRQGLVDIMLMSASSNYALTIRERLFENSHVTPAIRANDTTRRPPGPGLDTTRPLRPARSGPRASITPSAATSIAPRGAGDWRNLGSTASPSTMTSSRDTATLERIPSVPGGGRARRVPLLPRGLRPQRRPARASRRSCLGYLNDMIARMLAGVAPAGRPVFLKMVYHGPKAMEELVRYDPHLVIWNPRGIGRDHVRRLSAPGRRPEVRAPRLRSSGHKINSSREPARVRPVPRRIVDGVIGPVGGGQGVSRRARKAGECVLTARWKRTSETQAATMSYGGTGTSVTVPARSEPAPCPGRSGYEGNGVSPCSGE